MRAVARWNDEAGVEMPRAALEVRGLEAGVEMPRAALEVRGLRSELSPGSAIDRAFGKCSVASKL